MNIVFVFTNSFYIMPYCFILSYILTMLDNALMCLVVFCESWHVMLKDVVQDVSCYDSSGSQIVAPFLQVFVPKHAWRSAAYT